TVASPLVLGIGTGTGCIACASAWGRPGARVIALETSPRAAAMARDTFAALGVAGRVTVEVSDLFGALGTIRADIVVSNPPYLPTELIPTLSPEVSRHDPRIAMDGGPEGLTVIRRIVAEAPAWLVPGGALLLETFGGAQARQGRPARAGAGRLRAARSRLRLLPPRRGRAAHAVGARRPRQVVVGARGDEVSAADRGVLLGARHPGRDRAPRRLDRAGAAGRPRRAHRGPRAVGRDAPRERPGRGRRDHALHGSRHRQPRLDEDRARRGHTADRRHAGARGGVAMIRTLDARALGVDAVVRALERPPSRVPADVSATVDEILAAVRTRGDAAVLEYTAKLDGFAAASATALAISAAEMDDALRALEPATRAALDYAAERIERYHAAAVP